MSGPFLLCCERCRFVFEGVRPLTRCPDCGGGPVRAAGPAERADYAANRRRYGPMPAYGMEPSASAGGGRRSPHAEGHGSSVNT